MFLCVYKCYQRCERHDLWFCVFVTHFLLSISYPYTVHCTTLMCWPKPGRTQQKKAVENVTKTLERQ